MHILLKTRVGPGIHCSCIDATFGENQICNLYCAVENNDIEMIKVLMDSETFNLYGKSKIINTIDLSKEVDDIYNYKDSKTSIYLAVERRYYEIVKLILSFTKSFNINEEFHVDHKGYLDSSTYKQIKFPIHIAIDNEDNEMLELLLNDASNTINVNVECKITINYEKLYCFNVNKIEKKTPLIIAIEKDNINAVPLLLSHKKIDVNKQYSFKEDEKLDGFEYDEDNQGNEEEEQGDNERDKQQIIKKKHLYIWQLKKETLKLLYVINHKKIDINCRNKYLLMKPLLKIDFQKTVLQNAIQKKEIDIIKLLVEQKSISNNERTPYRFYREPKTCPKYNDDEEFLREEEEKVRWNIDRLKTPLHFEKYNSILSINKKLKIK